MATTPNSIITAQTPNAGVMNVLLTAAMTNTKAFDGTEATGAAKNELVYTVGANGGSVQEVRLKLTSTNGATASGTTAATLARIWLNNGSVNTTATNNQLLGEVAIPATAVTALGTTVLPDYTFPIGKTFPAGYKIYVGLTVAVGGTACAVQASAIGADL